MLVDLEALQTIYPIRGLQVHELCQQRKLMMSTQFTYKSTRKNEIKSKDAGNSHLLWEQWIRPTFHALQQAALRQVKFFRPQNIVAHKQIRETFQQKLRERKPCRVHQQRNINLQLAEQENPTCFRFPYYKNIP